MQIAVRECNSAQDVFDNARKVMAFRRSFDAPGPWQIRAEAALAELAIVKGERDQYRAQCAMMRALLSPPDAATEPAPATRLHPTIRRVQEAVCKAMRMEPCDMLAFRRDVATVRARQVAMYLTKQLTPRSLPDIGFHFGGRDHTTVIHAIRRIEELLEHDTDLAVLIDEIRAELALRDAG